MLCSLCVHIKNVWSDVRLADQKDLNELRRVRNLGVAYFESFNWSAVTCMRVLCPMKSISTQMRWSGSIVSTVAIKLAKGPVSISTLSPSLRLFGGNNVPDVSHLSIKPEISWSGSGLGLPPKLTSFDAPIVLLIVRHGASSAFTLTNMYPGKSGFRSLTKREAFLRVIFCMGRNVSNPCRCKLRSAKRWLFGLNCIKYQWPIFTTHSNAHIWTNITDLESMVNGSMPMTEFLTFVGIDDKLWSIIKISHWKKYLLPLP